MPLTPVLRVGSSRGLASACPHQEWDQGWLARGASPRAWHARCTKGLTHTLSQGLTGLRLYNNVRSLPCAAEMSVGAHTDPSNRQCQPFSAWSVPAPRQHREGLEIQLEGISRAELRGAPDTLQPLYAPACRERPTDGRTAHSVTPHQERTGQQKEQREMQDGCRGRHGGRSCGPRGAEASADENAGKPTLPEGSGIHATCRQLEAWRPAG